MQVAIGLLGLFLISGCVASWIWTLQKLVAGQQPIPWNDRRPVPWGLLDLAATFAIYLVGMALIVVLLNQTGWLPKGIDEEKLTLAQREVLVAAQSALSLGILVVALPLIALRTGANWADFGLSLTELWGDLKLGLMAFVMLVPPVYALQGLLVYFWKPSKHPLIEMFTSSPDATFFAVLFVAAAIVAPLFEEWIFRVLLQGYLERLFGRIAQPGALPLLSDEPPLAMAYQVSPAIGDPNPYSSPVITADPPILATLSELEQTALTGPAAMVPIAISSLIFALLHYTHGPDWVPLTLLAIGLGYLYQRTHRLVPSLVVHVLLNSMSMAGLWIQTYVPGMDGK